MNQKKGYITSEISQKNEGGRKGFWEAKGDENSHPRTKSLFPLGCRAVRFCVLSSYLIIANSQTSRHPIKAKLLDPLSTNSL